MPDSGDDGFSGLSSSPQEARHNVITDKNKIFLNFSINVVYYIIDDSSFANRKLFNSSTDRFSKKSKLKMAISSSQLLWSNVTPKIVFRKRSINGNQLFRHGMYEFHMSCKKGYASIWIGAFCSIF